MQETVRTKKHPTLSFLRAVRCLVKMKRKKLAYPPPTRWLSSQATLAQLWQAFFFFLVMDTHPVQGIILNGQEVLGKHLIPKIFFLHFFTEWVTNWSRHKFQRTKRSSRGIRKDSGYCLWKWGGWNLCFWTPCNAQLEGRFPGILAARNSLQQLFSQKCCQF